VAYAIAETARPYMQSDNGGDVGKGDVAKAPRNIVDRHVKRIQQPLAFTLNASLTVSILQPAMSTLSGARAVLVACFTIGARGILLDRKPTNAPLATANPGCFS